MSHAQLYSGDEPNVACICPGMAKCTCSSPCPPCSFVCWCNGPYSLAACVDLPRRSAGTSCGPVLWRLCLDSVAVWCLCPLPQPPGGGRKTSLKHQQPTQHEQITTLQGGHGQHRVFTSWSLKWRLQFSVHCRLSKLPKSFPATGISTGWNWCLRLSCKHRINIHFVHVF